MHGSVTDSGPSEIRLADEERQPCEIWTRVMGYHRPISEFNPGKKREQAERLPFREPGLAPAADR